ncbi:PhzF family phenazine biosynthesis protein [Pantoea sp. 1.19]|uniref:PhzF family phenazine biosynthesis protein n=1 Tax=Pantoea sp. 1.19 TaxID=1925589 RepID=UPI000948E52D|nr:PhzF family phenazine biosynthesis protein [Pantoea sp. 1.19]
MSPRTFKQVDVFTAEPLRGNPLAVVLQADGLSDSQMAAIARWTHLSETTFVLPASHPDADYSLRIFTPGGELPFAGHPTLGSAHALLESGLRPRQPGRLVQQCGIGLVTIRADGDGSLAFAAPPASLMPFHDARLDAVPGTGHACRVDMGIRWLLVPLPSASAVLAAELDSVTLSGLQQAACADGVALFGPHAGGEADYEVRALLMEAGERVEDPVTGSANACLARWLAAQGKTRDYRVRQGTRLQRAGLVQVRFRDDAIWVGGRCVTVIDGTLRV